MCDTDQTIEGTHYSLTGILLILYHIDLDTFAKLEKHQYERASMRGVTEIRVNLGGGYIHIHMSFQAIRWARKDTNDRKQNSIGYQLRTLAHLHQLG